VPITTLLYAFYTKEREGREGRWGAEGGRGGGINRKPYTFLAQ